MHGLLHVALRDLVLQLRSYGFWDLIVERTLEELHCLDDPREDDLLDTTKSYTDGVTEVLFKHAFAVLKCDRETGMLLVGDRHVRWLAESGYLSHLRRIDRSNVLELLEGVTKIHSHIERSFAHAIVPFFKVFPRSCPGGAFMIAYSSERATTAALFRGALIAAAELLCGQRLRLEEVPPPGAFDIAWLVQEVELFDTPELKGGHGLRGSSAQGLADLHTLMVPEVSSSPAASSTRTSLSDFPMPRLSISNYADTPTADGSIAAPRRSHQRTRRESDPDWASAAALNETTGQAREAILAEIERTHADALAQGIKAAALMRCVDPESVAADYTDPAQLSVASRFWAQSTGRLEHFLLSRPVPPEHADSLLVFVSHVWPEPADFAAIASVHVSYAEAKAIELGYAVQDLRRMRFGLAGADTASVLLWVDKACVAQEPHNLQATYLSHIQAFIALSGEMIVLLSWSYFERLWCLLEWACFLASNEPRFLHVACESMLTDTSVGAYVQSIRKLSVHETRCSVPEDRNTLLAMITSTFQSVSAFEHFAKVTAVALLARTTAKRAGRTGIDRFAQTWVKLAEELQQPKLADALLKADCAAWRVQSHEDAHLWAPGCTFRAQRKAGARRRSLDLALGGLPDPGRLQVPAQAAERTPCASRSATPKSTPRVSPAATPRRRQSDAPRVEGVQLTLRRSWRDAYLQYVDHWFVDEVEPLLLELKTLCVIHPS